MTRRASVTLPPSELRCQVQPPASCAAERLCARALAELVDGVDPVDFSGVEGGGTAVCVRFVDVLGLTKASPKLAPRRA